MQRLILGAVVGSENASPGVIRAIRSRLNFIYLAQLPQHSDTTLRVMQTKLADYNLARFVYIRNGSRRGKNGVINNMKFPKAHSPNHIFSNIKDTGVIDNYSTETSETMHIEACKDPWRESNRKDYMQQVIHRLTRHENIHAFSAYLQWRNQSWDDAYDDDSEESRPANGLTHIKIAKIPHRHCTPIDVVMAEHSIPGLSAAIIRFENSTDSGLDLFEHGIHPHEGLPPSFAQLDIWTSFCISPARPNEFYKVETFTIHCKPASATSDDFFDPVLVRVKGTGHNFTLKGTS